MIDYVEIRSKDTRELIGIIDTAKSIIWHVMYYDVGDFEIYVPCTPLTISLATEGNYVTRPNDRHVGIVEHVEITYNAQDGRMLIISGRMAKSILDRRVIYKRVLHLTPAFSKLAVINPTILSGNVESAARTVVTNNAIDCRFDTNRNISALVLGAHSGSTAIIQDADGNPSDKQVTYDNMLTWIDDFLKEYSIGAEILINDALKLEFVCFEGVDRSFDSTDHEPVIFSREFDNLVSSDLNYDETESKNMALVGGEGEGTERICAIKYGTETGIDRREMFIDASGTSQTYYDDEGQEQTLTKEDYAAQLVLIGAQELPNRQPLLSFDGEINLQNSVYKYGVDFDLGDIVSIQDNEINIYENVRIVEITEVQDDNGYNISAVYSL